MKSRRFFSGESIALVVAAACIAAGQPTGSISGTALDSTSGTALPGVKITLNYSEGSATTDEAGRFLFDNLKPGKYFLKGEKEGFANLEGQFPSPIRLAAGEKVTGFALRLSPEAVVSGRVLNAKGEPINASVTLSQAENRGHVAFERAAAGVFRIGGLTAGIYKLSAQVSGARGATQFALTHYPSETLWKQAATITLKHGEQKSGMDIVLQEVRLVTIRGQFLGTIPAGWRGSVSRQSLNGEPLGTTGSSLLDPERRFTLQLPPGEYRLRVMAMPQSPEQPVIFGFLDLRVTDNVDDVVIPASPIRSIRGKFRWAGSGRKDPLEGTFSLNPMEGLGILQHAKLDAEGWAVAERVSPDRYSFLVDNLPEGTYVRSILAGGRDITERGLDLISGVSTELEFVVADDGGVVTGQVVDAANRPVQGGRISIVRATTHRPALALWSRHSAWDATGQFSEIGIAPGEYTVTARANGKTSPTKTIRVVAGERQHILCELP